MLWVLIAIFAYFLIAITNLGDKYLLAGPPNPKIYSFYVGLLGIAVLLLIPFIGFSLPSFAQLVFALAAGVVFILGIFSFYNALEKFETSRVVPAIGGFLPLFTLGLIYFFKSGEEILISKDFIALALLILGGVFITFQKEKGISFRSLPISILTAFLLSLVFLLSKFVYLSQPFWSGFILMRVGGFFAALGFIFFNEVREEIFRMKTTFNKKNGFIFLFNQTLGAIAFILQNWAIALVPLVFLPFINALEGTKYVFLLILTAIISLKFPKFLKEEVSGKTLFQKITATLFIVAGLILFAF